MRQRDTPVMGNLIDLGDPRRVENYLIYFVCNSLNFQLFEQLIAGAIIRSSELRCFLLEHGALAKSAVAGDGETERLRTAV